ncbi:uncharacterized protein LOC143613152 [Bidens hawaiensis]|uniref:uncharacterized protein LOC143613152 n=1 Tax=Bidens hawaiensis TaxID=980011 RepID=UPI00404B99BE
MEGHDQESSRVKLNAIVATVGLLSATLGFAAEATKIQLEEIQNIYRMGCTYPEHSGATALAVVALVTLLGFRVYCPGTRSQSSSVQLSRYLSWVAWFVAMSFYVVGLLMAKLQGHQYEPQTNFQHYDKCNVVKPGIFSAGASFALTSVVLEIVYLVTATQHQTDKTASNPSTGQPSILSMC